RVRQGRGPEPAPRGLDGLRRRVLPAERPRRGPAPGGRLQVRHRLAAPVALVAAVAVFAVVFLLTGSLLWSPLLAVAGALGVYLMLDDRSALRAQSDSYADEAQGKVEEALRIVRGIQKLSRDVRAPAARAALESACRYVPELFERVRVKSPNSLYSTA